MLRMIGYGENIGSGFPLILKAWDQNHWLKPELFEQPELMQVRLVLTIEPKNVGKDGIKSGIKDGTKELSERQLGILNLIKEDCTITTYDLTQKVGISQRTLMRELAFLQEVGILTRQGNRKNGKWMIGINVMVKDHWDANAKTSEEVERSREKSKEKLVGEENVTSSVTSDVTSDADSLFVIQLTERQKKIYEMIKKNPRISVKEMSLVLSLVERTIKRDLAAMQKKGLLIREGNTSADHWIVIQKQI